MEKLDSSGKRRIVTVFLTYAVQVMLLFLAAGRVDLPRAWLFAALTIVVPLCAISIMLKYCPHTVDLINRRGKFQEGSNKWDKIVTVSLMPVWMSVPIIAGLDLGRFHWSRVSIYYVIPGLIAALAGYFVTYWAMFVNKFFETTVRIQKDLNHYVVQEGPYRYIRHPGYAGMTLSMLGMPLILGSLYSFIPASLIILFAFIRTAYEDKKLRRELTGYEEYAQKVRYRLFPGIW